MVTGRSKSNSTAPVPKQSKIMQQQHVGFATTTTTTTYETKPAIQHIPPTRPLPTVTVQLPKIEKDEQEHSNEHEDIETEEPHYHHPLSGKVKIPSAVFKIEDLPNPELKRISKRNQLLNEIVTSERNYVHQLDTLIQGYLDPIELKHTQDPAHSPLKQEEYNDLHSVVANIKIIFTYNNNFLSDLEKIDIKSKEVEKQTAEAFVKVAPWLKSYSVYINNYEKATDIITHHSPDSPFSTLVKS